MTQEVFAFEVSFQHRLGIVLRDRAFVILVAGIRNKFILKQPCNF